MPLTKIDDKGRILLPKQIRDEMNLKPSEELFVIKAGKDSILLRKMNIKHMLKDLIEKAKEIDLDKLEEELEQEGNKIAKKKHPNIFD